MCTCWLAAADASAAAIAAVSVAAPAAPAGFPARMVPSPSQSSGQRTASIFGRGRRQSNRQGELEIATGKVVRAAGNGVRSKPNGEANWAADCIAAGGAVAGPGAVSPSVLSLSAQAFCWVGKVGVRYVLLVFVFSCSETVEGLAGMGGPTLSLKYVQGAGFIITCIHLME